MGLRHGAIGAVYTDLVEWGNLSDDDPLKVYLAEIHTIQPLTKGEETDLLRDVRTQGEAAELASRRLIEAKLSLVVSIAQRHSSVGIDMLDLIQRGNEGLMLALDTFDGSSCDEFATYATTCIEGAVSKAVAELRPTSK